MEEQPRSWLSLVIFCAVTVLIAALGAAVLFAGASVAFAVAHPGQVENTDPIPSESVVPVMMAEAPVEQPTLSEPLEDGATGSVGTFAGMITDSRCGARHRMNSDKTSAECTRSCVRKGAHYVLVDGEKIYALQGDHRQLEKLAGQRVNVTGMLEGDTIKVKTVTQE
ncbi:MAG: hypothetical protein ACRD20_06475 [Terriglobales bacterium]